MAKNWLKTIDCKSNNDVVDRWKPKKPYNFMSNTLCSSNTTTHNSINFEVTHKTTRKPRKQRPLPPPPLMAMPAFSLPALVELSAGHSSRRVVEIIFSSRWSSSGNALPFPGHVEMLFRIENSPRTTASFEEYRSEVQSKSSEDARCAADGNEMMQFHCSSSMSSGEIIITDVTVHKDGGIRMFSQSGTAHESSGGGGGRRAMLLCRVIAGRVRDGPVREPGRNFRFDSVSVCEGELLVFDPRAVLPCFLIVYTV